MPSPKRNVPEENFTVLQITLDSIRKSLSKFHTVALYSFPGDQEWSLWARLEALPLSVLPSEGPS